MPLSTTENIGIAQPLMIWRFSSAKVAPSQTNLAMSTTATDATSGSLGVNQVVMPFGGFIVGITASWSGTGPTAGTCSIAASINGTATSGVLAVPTTTVTTSSRLFEYGNNAPYFAPGAQLGALITTNAGFLPNATIDVWVEIYVILVDAYV